MIQNPAGSGGDTVHGRADVVSKQERFHAPQRYKRFQHPIDHPRKGVEWVYKYIKQRQRREHRARLQRPAQQNHQAKGQQREQRRGGCPEEHAQCVQVPEVQRQTMFLVKVSVICCFKYSNTNNKQMQPTYIHKGRHVQQLGQIHFVGCTTKIIGMQNVLKHNPCDGQNISQH